MTGGLSLCRAPKLTFLRKLAAFSHNRSGNTVIILSLVAPAVMMLLGAGLDYSYVSMQKSKLQLAVDAAVIAAAKEMSLSDADNARLAAVGKAVVISNLNNQRAAGLAVQVAVGADRKVLVLKAAHKSDQIFNFDVMKLDTIAATAEAKVFGTVRVCAIGLSSKLSGTVMLDANARMTGVGCAVFSNSLNSAGLMSKKNANLKASLICSAGGFNGGKANFSPEPMTDCPPFEDPLSNRPEPYTGTCTHNNKIIEKGMPALYPGTYCGGLKIGGTADVRLNPGLYIMKDGPLQVSDTAKIAGTNVGFYYTGPKAVFDFSSDTTISLTAPKSGVMAGILMFEGRQGKALEKHNISSNNARTLLGTIYLPRGRLYIDAVAPIADYSAYTVVIANQINLFEGPHLVLNTNYGQTDIPVPDGIKGAVRNVMLSK